ncbi:hypothetical protein EYF88_15935 [Paracoccus sediminis]|uniref:Uncharacterized protein n=1 Tax=Paracoccus sediminis TaxID=1214787 RepID=A0A238YA84_9RHOB|nr:hypothetical protein [Paracoccus sediminis]TBN47001.1 hypothetical protein EYF88_15935 [Paracoccus sediminis]SNR67504.1 hypothetical protein SAMN06265378_1166 [Paracoccus sediminis]
MTRSVTALLGSVAILSLATPALADEARYYTSQSVTCDGRSHVLELRVAPNDEPNIRLFWRGQDNRISGRDWHLPAEFLEGQSVVLDQLANYPKGQVSGLESDAPELQLLGFDGAPLPGCEAFRFAPAKVPQARYDAVLAMLEADAPTPAAVAAARAAAEALPPPVLLPPLDQQGKRRAVQDGLKTMGSRMVERARALAGEIEGDEAAALLPELRDAWRASRDRADAELLTELQDTRALALMVAGRDMSAMAETDPARICATVDGVSTNMMSPTFSRVGEETLLEIASGVPVQHWTREFAETTMDLSQSCADDRYETLAAQAWPRIEARIAGMDKLRATVATLAATPVTVDAYRAANWLTVDPSTLRDAGLSREEIDRVLRPATARLLENAVPVLAEELAQGVADESDIPAVTSHCARRIGAVMAGMDTMVAARITRACEDIAAAHLTRVGMARIAEKAARAEAAGESYEDALATDGYAVLPDFGPRPAGAAFDAAVAELNAAAQEAEARVADKRARVLAAEAERLAAAYAGLEPGSPDTAVLLNCTRYPEAPLLTGLHGQCQELSAAFQAQHGETHCARLYEEAKADDDLRDAQLDLGEKGLLPLRRLLCHLPAAATLTRHGGLFRDTRYEVGLQAQGKSGVQTLTGTLAPAGAPGVWRLTEIALEPGPLRDAPATLDLCLGHPDRCVD